jgi:hypothetical protein
VQRVVALNLCSGCLPGDSGELVRIADDVEIDGAGGELTVRLRKQGGTVLFTKVLQPGRPGRWTAARGEGHRPGCPGSPGRAATGR